MKNTKYTPRIIDKKIAWALDTFGAICVEGPKWCGKTWTSMHHSNSAVFLSDPEANFQNRWLAQTSPDLVLDGEIPHLVDEWQDVPEIWDAVRFRVDQDNQKGQIILTGSSTPNHKGILHSGAGRIGRIRMRPMSLYESRDSSGDISLEDICRGDFKAKKCRKTTLQDIVGLIVRGGWPGSLGLDNKKASNVAKQYIDAIIDDDVYRLDGVKRDGVKMHMLLKSLARNESTTASNATLVKDIKNIDKENIDGNTVALYMDVFTRLFIIDNQLPFTSAIRSSARLKKAPKRHLADPSLACALLKLNENKLINDLKTLGFLFEALCERDLRIYADSFDGMLYHYQDYDNREIDAIIEMDDGNWCAFEIKLGAHQIDEAAKNLLDIKRRIEADDGGKPPSVLCVICGLTDYAYLREDGVYVVPIMGLRE